MGFKGRHPSFHSASMPFIKNELASDIGLDYFLSPLLENHGRGFHRRENSGSTGLVETEFGFRF